MNTPEQQRATWQAIYKLAKQLEDKRDGMTIKLDLTEYTLPAYWAPYLINDDASGLNDAEQAECDAFCNGLGFCIDMRDESEFGHNDANNLAGATAVFTFQKVGNEPDPFPVDPDKPYGDTL